MRKLKITEMGRMNIEEFRASEKMPLIVVLDDVRSMYNVGSVFRTADAFRVEAIYLCGITAQPPHPEIHKTALGAEDTVAWQHFPTALDAVNTLKQQGYTVFSIEQCEGSTQLNELDSQLSTLNPKLSALNSKLSALNYYLTTPRQSPPLSSRNRAPEFVWQVQDRRFSLSCPCRARGQTADESSPADGRSG